MIFFTSDTHYGHKNILRYCNRPFDNVAEMDEALIEEHNAVVGPRDTVYHLGDFAFAQPNRILDILSKLNGKYHFLSGNHDSQMLQLLREQKVNKVNLMPQYVERRDLGVCMFHYPIGSWNGMRHGSIMLHGHCHGNYKYSYPNSKIDGKIIDVGVDCHEYRPVSLDEIKEMALELEFKITPDHHE